MPMPMLRPHLTLVLSMAIVLVTACTRAEIAGPSAPSASGSPHVTPASGSPSASPALSGSPLESAVPSDLAEAVRVRKEFGLRWDEAWVRAVAADPTAVMDFGVPLMPFERNDIMSRPPGGDAATSAMFDYLSAHPEISGGMYIDQSSGGILTALVTDEPEVHEEALRAVIGPSVPIVVRQVRWTERELTEIYERIVADEAFLAGIPARLKTASVDIIGNVATLEISSTVKDAAERIGEHFAVLPGQLHVSSDGTGILLMPVGRILGRVIPPPATGGILGVQYEADIDIGPRDAIGIGVLADGTFTIEGLPPTTYTITIVEHLDTGYITVGTARATVPPGGEVSIEIQYGKP